MKKHPEPVSDHDDAKSPTGIDECAVSGNADSNDEPLRRLQPSGKTLAALAKVADVTDMSKGKLGGALFTDDEGYTYIHHSSSAFRRQLRCSNSNLRRNKCRARASVTLHDKNPIVVMSSKCPPHNHPPVTESTLASKFARLLKRRVYSCPNTPIAQLYDEECKRFPEGAECLPRRTALQRMQRYRREYSAALFGKDTPSCPPSNDDQSIPSTELKLLAEGRIIYVDHKGYHYHQHHVTTNKRQLRCTKARFRGYMCPARASMDLKPRYGHIKLTRNRHNHPPPDADGALFSYNLKLRAREELDKSLKQIYEEEAEKTPDVAAVVTYSKMRQCMQRARRLSAENSAVTSQDANLSFDSVYDLATEEAQDGQVVDGEKTEVDAANSAIADVTGSETVPAASHDAKSVKDVTSGTRRRSPKLSAAQSVTSGPVPTVEVVVSAQQGAGLEMVLYQCPYCQKLFDEDEPLEQHILTSHINLIVPESNMWEEASLPK